MKTYLAILISTILLLCFSCEKELTEIRPEEEKVLPELPRALALHDLLCTHQGHNCHAFHQGSAQLGYVGQDSIWYEKKNGFQIIHGDIIAPKGMITEQPSELDMRAASHSDLFLWPNGVVYYSLARSLPEQLKVNFLLAAQIWSTYTSVKFVERTNEPNFIYVFQGAGNFSHLGFQGGIQDLSLNDTNLGVALHEIGHALCLIHEHQRSDRDNYVWVNPAVANNNNFAALARSWNYSSFDWNSIMLYPSRQFQDGSWDLLERSSGQPFINSIEYWAQFGLFAYPSPKDFEIINYLY